MTNFQVKQNESGEHYKIPNNITHGNQAMWLKKILIANDWVHPETSERRIYGAAQYVMDMLDDPNNYHTLSWLRFSDNSAFWLYTYWINNLPMGFLNTIIKLQWQKDAYKTLLSLVQNETKEIFKENDKSNYTRSSEEFRITKVKKGLLELNEHRNDSKFNLDYNDWMFQILYLLHESFGNEYLKKYGNYYQTEKQKEELEAMKERTKQVKIS